MTTALYLMTQDEYTKGAAAEVERQRNSPYNDPGNLSGISHKRLGKFQQQRWQSGLSRHSVLAALDDLNAKKAEHTEAVRAAARSGELTEDDYNRIHAATYGEYAAFVAPTPEEQAAARREQVKEAMARLKDEVHTAGIGDTVLDSAYGKCTVVRVNKKTLTIRTASGYQEARPFSLITCILKRAGAAAAAQ